jgi:hypothetical protein
MAEKVDIVHATLPKPVQKKDTKVATSTAKKNTAGATATTNYVTQREDQDLNYFQEDENIYHMESRDPSPDPANITPQGDQFESVATNFGKELCTYLVKNLTGKQTDTPVSTVVTPTLDPKPKQTTQQYQSSSPNRRPYSPNRPNQRPQSPNNQYQRSNYRPSNGSPGRSQESERRPYEPRQPYPTSTPTQQKQSADTSVAGAVAKPEFKWNYLKGECSFCGVVGQHTPPECKLYLSLTKEAKWDAVSNRHLCYHCLRFGHGVRTCNINRGKLCGVNGCTREHHHTLHLSDPIKAGQKVLQIEEIYDFTTFYAVYDQDENSHFIRTQEIFRADGDTPTAIQTINCILTVKGKKTPIIAILDTGSNNTNIDLAFAKKSGMELLGPARERYVRFMDRDTKIESHLVSFQLTASDGHTTQTMFAWTIDGLADTNPGVDWTKEKLKYPHLADLPIIKPADPGVPVLLIGSNNALMFTQLDHRFGKKGEPVGFRTPLGWSIFGRHAGWLKKHKHPIVAHTYKVEDKRLDDLYELVKKQNDLDLIGLHEKEPPFSKGYHGGAKPKKLWSQQEKDADAKMVITKIDGDIPYYQAKMPWKEDPTSKLEGNYRSIAMRQGKVWKNLEKFGTSEEEYSACLQAFIDKGYVEDVPKDEITQGWYVPHRPVVNRDKATTQVRPVFDCGALYKGVSANLNTEAGPNRLNDIFHVLLRWRRYEYAFTGDISEMFLRVRLAPEDRKYFRFMIGNRHVQWTRVPFGGNACPNISQKVLETLEQDYGKDYPAAIDVIINSFYMDDGIDSRPTEEEVMSSVTDLMGILQNADMHIGKFYSNSKKTYRQPTSR